MIVTVKSIFAARSDAGISGHTGRDLPMGHDRAVPPEIPARDAREDGVTA